MEDQTYISVEQLAELRHKIIKAKHRMDITTNRSGLAERLFTNYIHQIVDGYRPVISRLASNNGDRIFRARKCIDDKPFDNIRDLYHPPTPMPKGRAHTSGTMPILYASSSLQTCLSEIDIKIGDLVNIAHFSYSNIMNGKFWFVGELGAFHKSKEQSRYLKDERTLKIHAYAHPKGINSLVFKDLLIHEIFSKLSSDLDEYVLNRFLIEAIREKQSKKEDFYGVVFASAKDAPGRNFAIYGDAINKLKLSNVNSVRIADIDDYGCVGFEELRNSSPENGSLTWPEHYIA